VSLLRRTSERVDRIAKDLLSGPPVDLVRILTLMMLLLHGPTEWYVRNPLVLLGLAGLVFPAARSSPRLWFPIAAFLLAHAIVGWASVDNHKWLMGWWSLAMGLTTLAPQKSQLRVLQTNARLLLGLCFAFATLWKALSFDYLDSTYFRWGLLVDPRFESAALYVGGAKASDLEENRKLYKDVDESYLWEAEPVDSITLSSGPRIDLIALTITWWTILIEGSIALLCLWPGGRLVAIVRSLIVLVFATTTYVMAPVLGFGWTVILLGFAQCPEQHRKLRAGFLLTVGLIYFYRLKIGSMLVKTAEYGFAEMTRFY